MTKPSIVPATTKASTSPRAITAERRPCSPSASGAWAVARIDDRPPDGQPGPAGDDDGRELEEPVGEDQPVELRLLADGGEQPGGRPRLSPLFTRMNAVTTHSRIPAAKARKPTWMLFTVTRVANSLAGAEE